MSKILLCPVCNKRKAVRNDADVCGSSCRVKKFRGEIKMNDYLKGAVDTCKALAKDEKEFLQNVKKATGFTDKGIRDHEYIQGLIATWK